MAERERRSLRLALGPGGSAALSIFTFLQNIPRPEEISGASAGALAAFGYLIGMTLDDILRTDFGGLIKYSIKNFIKNGGLADTSKFRDELLKYSKETFKELYEHTGIKFYIAATSVAKGSVDYFSIDTAPDMQVADAVAASISVPFLFAPHMGYIDGGLVEEIPATPFIGREFLAVRVPVDPPKTIQGPMGLLNSILNIVYNLRARSTYPNVVDIQIPPVNVFNFKLSTDDKLRLALAGVKASYKVSQSENSPLEA